MFLFIAILFIEFLFIVWDRDKWVEGYDTAFRESVEAVSGPAGYPTQWLQLHQYSQGRTAERQPEVTY